MPHRMLGQVTLPIAELDRRFYAFAIDRAFAWSFAAVAGTVAWLLAGSWQAVLAGAGGAVLAWWLVTSVVVGIKGTSPGKALVGLRVVHHGTGTPIGVGPALLRSFLLGVLGLPTFGIGLAALAWTAVEDSGRQRRGWHDQVTSSVVVDVRPVVEQSVALPDDAPRHVVNLTALRLVPAPPVEQPVTPPRTANTEQSVRRQPLPEAVTPDPATQRPAITEAAEPGQEHPGHDPGRTVSRGPRTTAIVWRVLFDNGETFVVEGLALVGRKPEPRPGEPVRHLVPLTSQDMSVSKTHAQFGPTADGTLAVMDRGSTNGTAVLRQGVSRQLDAGKPATLLHGDTVIFGDRRMSVSREA